MKGYASLEKAKRDLVFRWGVGNSTGGQFLRSKLMKCDICGGNRKDCGCYYVQCKKCGLFKDHGDIISNCQCEEPEWEYEEE